MTSFGQKSNTTAKSQYDFGGVSTKPPPSSYKQMESRGGKPLGTALQGGPEGRPLTSNKAVGFTSKLTNQANELLNTKTKFDVNRRVDNNPQENFKKLQKQINALIEESASCKLRGSYTQALEKAKQAVNKEKNLRKLREANNTMDAINPDLSYCVLFNLAVSLEANGMIQQALTKYTEIIKSKQFPQAGRLRVNMGNIYFQQKKYPIAIKMYRMALDIIPTTSKEMRFKILKNIGHAFIKLGQFQEAITSYENIMKGSPDHKTAFNLLLCLYASGDKLRMKDCFSSMLVNENEEEEAVDDDDDNKNNNDKLKEEMKERRRQELRLIIMASKLIAPVIENDIIQSYDWILEKLKTSSYPEAQSEVQIFKALALLKKKQIDKAIETLKTLEKKDSVTMGRVASNISFLHFLENDYKSAEKYVDIAINYDRYNAKALVNKGNCLFMKNDFMRAKEQYLEAIGVQADCVEALYNLGYVNKKLNLFMEALQALEKLQTIIAIPEAIFQIGNIHEIIGNTKQALKWYQVLLTKVPNDAGTLARVGNIFFREDDQQQALHYYMESYRLLPTNIDTNIWLGIYYVKQGAYEKACHYLERASQLQPKEVKWRLMVASCQRRIGNFQKALKIYEAIYQEYPDNIECLRFLVLLCKDMGRDYEEYTRQLNQLEMAAKITYDNPVEQVQNEPERVQEQNVNIRVSDNNTRRKQQEIKKVQKEQENWEDVDVGFN